MAVLLFLDRRTGMTASGMRDVVRAGALSGRKSARARRPMGRLDPRPRRPGALAARRARRAARRRAAGALLTAPSPLAPLALWSLREQLRLEGIEIPQITATKGELRAADLVALADSVPEAEFEAEVGAWVTALAPTGPRATCSRSRRSAGRSCGWWR